MKDTGKNRFKNGVDETWIRLPYSVNGLDVCNIRLDRLSCVLFADQVIVLCLHIYETPSYKNFHEVTYICSKEREMC